MLIYIFFIDTRVVWGLLCLGHFVAFTLPFTALYFVSTHRLVIEFMVLSGTHQLF